MIRIGLIPLDSRPCNTIWLKQLTKAVDYELINYPFNLCGDLKKGAKLDEMIIWLKENVMKMDYLILSTDGFCFGGLVQAREALINLDEVINKLSIFEELKRLNPQLIIYVFDTIMRTSITATSEETAKYWQKMNEYSKLKGLCYFYKKETDKDKLKALEEIIPSSIIETYLKARDKKHQINKAFINLLNDKKIDHIILLQEDAVVEGIQKIEQVKLLSLIKEHELNDLVQFYNGTDEGALILLAKIIVNNEKRKLYTYLLTPSREVLNKVCLFEDQLLIDNINKMFKTVGLIRTEDLTKTNSVLAVFCQKDNPDLDLTIYNEVLINKDEEYNNFIKQVNNLINKNYQVTLADVYFPNGGSYELLNDVLYQNLFGYSAWNTASNTLGLSIVLLVISMVKYNKNITDDFLKERIMDDCIYQYIVRRKVAESLITKGINVYKLEEYTEEAINLINKLIHQYDEMINNKDYTFDLPWSRMFEINIKMKK